MNKFIKLTLFIIPCLLLQQCSKDNTVIQNLNGWHLMGEFRDSCDIGLDTAKHEGQPVYFIRSNSINKEAVGTAANNIDPDKFIGKRVRMTGFIKTENSGKFAQMFMRVNGGAGAGFSGKTLAFDDMQNRPIKGTTDWQKYEIVLDVSQETSSILYGVHVFGRGEAWFSGFSFEAVGNDVPPTDMMKK